MQSPRRSVPRDRSGGRCALGTGSYKTAKHRPGDPNRIARFFCGLVVQWTSTSGCQPEGRGFDSRRGRAEKVRAETSPHPLEPQAQARGQGGSRGPSACERIPTNEGATGLHRASFSGALSSRTSKRVCAERVGKDSHAGGCEKGFSHQQTGRLRRRRGGPRLENGWCITAWGSTPQPSASPSERGLARAVPRRLACMPVASAPVRVLLVGRDSHGRRCDRTAPHHVYVVPSRAHSVLAPAASTA